MNKNIEKLIATAKKEVGYLEKASNKDLDSKTANAGSENWTKYARDLDALGNVYNGPKQHQPWCDLFIDWCFITTFGLTLGMALLCQEYKGLGAGCTYSAGYYKKKGQFYTSGPQPGDQIFFTNDNGKTSCHTGLVIDTDKSKVYTIEGNTSSAPGVIPNGGAVADKSYLLTSNRIYGYGRPDWSLCPSDEEEIEMEKWNKLSEIPESYRDSIKTLVDAKCLNGINAAGDLDLTRIEARIYTVMLRAKKAGLI